MNWLTNTSNEYTNQRLLDNYCRILCFPNICASMLLFSLRGQGNAVTALTPTSIGLILGDRNGLVIVWNLKLRRPLIQWPAHTDMVVTILEWNQYVVTHGKDGEIRVWQMDDQPKQIASIPVNTLNFCNIALSGRYLFTAATTDLNNFDVYKIDEEDKSLSRVITSFSGYSLVENVPEGRDWGVIMNMIYLPLSLILCLGYESGDVLGIEIDFEREERSSTTTTGNTGGLGLLSMFSKVTERTMINRDPKLTLRYHNTSHRPEPVTSSHWDDFHQRLFTASASTKMVVHNILEDNQQEVTLLTPGVQAIATSINGVVVGHWDGRLEIRANEDNYPVVKSEARSIPGENAYNNDTGRLVAQVKLTSVAITTVPVRRGEKSVAVGGYEDGVITAFSLDNV